jgi:hypothetical protein
MENVKIPTGTLIPRSALWILYPDSQVTTIPLETFPSHIGVYANMTLEASLCSRFIMTLKEDPLAQEYHDNFLKP